ncbi:LysR family transcriptional regulator [Nonomuraea sp. NPDC003804]|uniref:LysR family transcriptional regulator n=1 Tax=Nonomuraea sp. NPDC003804 TaxID=3154547 RepID=UPI0033B10672
MELRQLRTFETLLRHGTVTDAAVALDLAPSSVSEQIRALERSLGVSLFERTPRGMRPTAAAERLTGWARRLLELAEQARLEVTGQPYRLRLGALETIAATHAPRVLAHLAEHHPGLEVRVRPSSSRDELMAEVAAGRLEAALLLDAGQALGGLGFAPPEPLTFLDVDEVPLVLVAAPGHPLAGRGLVGPGDLAGERLLVNVPGCSFRLAADSVLGPAPERVAAGGVAVMRAWAEQGLGIALLPEFAVAPALESGALVRLALPAPRLSLRLVWREDREELPGLRQLLYAAAGRPHHS